jgi:hypothetical protein
VGERLSIPYEAPQGRRVNAIGLYCSQGPAAGRFLFETAASLPEQRAKKARKSLAEQAAAHGLRPEQVGKIDSERLIAFIWKAAGRPPVHAAQWRRERPLVIWLDNYSVHKSERVQAELPEWEQAGITLCYLPSYSPELSRMEPIWHPVKHQDIVRPHVVDADDAGAVHDGGGDGGGGAFEALVGGEAAEDAADR